MFCYICGLRSNFPKDVLTSTRNFVDIGLDETPNNKKVSEPGLLHIRIAELANMHRTFKEEVEKERKDRDKKLADLVGEVHRLKQELDYVREHCISTETCTLTETAKSEKSRVTIARPVGEQFTPTQQCQPGLNEERVNEANHQTTPASISLTESNHDWSATKRDNPKQACEKSADRQLEKKSGAVESREGINANKIVSRCERETVPRVDTISTTCSSSTDSSTDKERQTSVSENSPATYSSVLQEVNGPWNTVTRRNKRTSDRRKQKRLQARQYKPRDVVHEQAKKVLKGLKPEEGIQLYIENIHKDLADTSSEIERMVKIHGHKQGIRIVAARMVKNGFCDDIVGCRITVPLSQVATTMDDDTWPDEVTCRKWETRRPRSQQNTNYNQRHNYDCQERYGEKYGRPNTNRDTDNGRYRTDRDTRSQQQESRGRIPWKDLLEYEDVSVEGDNSWYCDDYDDNALQDAWRHIRDEDY